MAADFFRLFFVVFWLVLTTRDDCLKFSLHFLLLDLLSIWSTAVTPSNVAEDENADVGMAKGLTSRQMCFLFCLPAVLCMCDP
jgi:hypothetical protein